MWQSTDSENFDMYFGASKELILRARELRVNCTKAEADLWKHISKKQLGAKFRRQHPISYFIVDFYCVMQKVAIEVDGAIHLEEKQHEKDMARQAHLESLGIRLIRVTNTEVFNEIETCLHRIRSLLNKAK